MPPNTFNLNSASNLSTPGAFQSGSEARLILGMVGPPTGIPTSLGYGYAFASWQSFNNKIGVIKYIPTTSGVTSQSATHLLARSLSDFTVVRTEPASGKIFLLGGRSGSTFSNEYFTFADSTGFRLPSSGAIVPASPNQQPDRMGFGLIPSRAGMTGVGIGGNKILLFGGYDTNGMRSEVYEFDVTTSPPSWTAKANIPVSLKNAKALVSGSNGIISWVYVVGGATSPGTDTDNRRVYRYDVASDTWCKVQDANGADIIIPGTRPVEIASLHGIYILTQSEDEQSMILYKLSHPNPSLVTLPATGALGTAKGSVLTSKSRTLPLRARSHFGLLRCFDDTWVIGGSTGHTPNLQNRGSFVDKLIP